MNTSHIVRRVALTTAVAGAAALTAGPALAKPGPIDYGSLQQSAPSAAHATKAQVEHEEAALTTTTTTAGLPQQIKARVEQLERATADRPPAVQPVGRDSSGSSSFPVGAFVLVGGALVVAGGAGMIMYRFRHDGTGGTGGNGGGGSRVGTATA